MLRVQTRGEAFDCLRVGHCEDKETMDRLRMPPRMKRRLWTMRVSALVGLLGLPGILAAQRAELERQIERQTLDNGLEVIVVRNRGVPLVTIEADVKNGSFTQGPQFEGLSHLYEHMFFKANA